MTSTIQPVTYVLLLDLENQKDEETKYHTPLYNHSCANLVVFSIFIMIAYLLNLFVTFTILLNRYLRRTPFNVIQLSFNILNLVDCSLNGTIAIIYMVHIVWDIPIHVCYFNMYVINCVDAIRSYIAIQSAMDRFVYLKYAKSYRNHFGNKNQLIGIFIIISTTTLLTIPFLLISEVRPYPARMSCGVYSLKGNSVLFTVFTYFMQLFNVALPSILLMSFLFIFMKILYDNKRETNRILAERVLHNNTSLNWSISRQLLRPLDIKLLGIVLTVITTILFCTMPYAIHSFIQQVYYPQNEIIDSFQEVCWTPETDVSLAWLRCLTILAHPTAVLVFYDDVRQELAYLLSELISGNSDMYATESSPLITYRPCKLLSYFGFEIPYKTPSPDGTTTPTRASRTTPVLFPTNNGLYLRRMCNNNTEYEYVFCDYYDSCCEMNNVSINGND